MTTPLVDAIYPLSPQQQGILFETLTDPGSGIYFEQEVHRFEGDLRVDAFEPAWQVLGDRHAMLRTACAWRTQEQPLQVVLRSAPVSVSRVDWSDLDSRDRDDRLAAYLADERRRPFDVARPPLMRLTLIRTASHGHVFVWTQHHLLMDGWSRQVLAREFLDAYAALCADREPQLP